MLDDLESRTIGRRDGLEGIFRLNSSGLDRGHPEPASSEREAQQSQDGLAVALQAAYACQDGVFLPTAG